jgi:hypothetical protein
MSSDFGRRVISMCAGLALLAGCGFPGVVPKQPSGAANAGAAAPGSRIAPGVGRQDLLYVSDVGTGKVNVYSYPRGKLVATLSGFQRPQAMCVDKAGDVFIPDLNASKIYEYRHGAKKPKAVLRDPGQDPDDCAVDPTTGDLAVANLSTPYSGPGNLVIYAHGKRTVFRDPQFRYYLFCGYDNQGNLYLDGMSSGVFKFAELPKGSTSFVDITLDKKFRFGGAVQWDGRDVAVGDYESNAIYQFEIDGATGTKVGETRLDGSDYAIGFWIEGKKVIGPNNDSTSVMYWNYPAGGTQTKRIKGLHTPWGAVVSLAN